LGLGFGAAVLGAGIYFGIAALTGYEFGLVAIVVGVLVGSAVRKGSNGRGGWRYQLLAKFLTYTAVVVTDSSLIARELKNEWRAQAASSAAAPAGVNASTDAALGTSPRPGPLMVAFGLALIIALLACPSCQRLVHAEELKRLAATAERAAQGGDPSAALAAWRQALDLLPTDATQYQVVAARIAGLSRSLDATPATAGHGARWGKEAAGVGALGALLFKFKFALLFVLTKAKLLLLGLTKGGRAAGAARHRRRRGGRPQPRGR
jgi:hypothetical protein